MSLADSRPRDRIVLPENRRFELERGDIILERLPPAQGIPGVFVHGLLRCSPDQVWDILIDYRSLSEAIFGLSSAEVVEGAPGDAAVRFTMKLPFPFGAISWINRVRAEEREGLYVVSWDYLEGDLATNEGWLAMTQHGAGGDQTYVHYQVQVGTRSRLPRSAERLALKRILPKVVERLRKVAESRSR
jgi:hypothetical protein